MTKGNPRRANGSRRSKLLAWLRAQGMPCHICGLPIDYGAPAGSPCAPECDELVPVSRGGSPYDRANVAPAHRCCNNWRRNRSLGYVGRGRSAGLAAGPCSPPVEFVSRARRAEGRGETAARPPRIETTTDW